MKKVISLLMAILMVASLSVFVLADEEPTVFMPEGTAVLNETAAVVEEETVLVEEAPADAAPVQAAVEAEDTEEAPEVDGAGGLKVSLVPAAGEAKVAKGGVKTFNVVVTEVAKFCAYQITFSADTGLTVTGATCGTLPQTSAKDNSSFNATSKSLVWYNPSVSSTSGDVTPTTNQVIATVTVKADSGLTVGAKYNVYVDVKAVDFDSENYVEIQKSGVHSAACEVEIASFTYGDVDGKNGISITDLVQLADYIANYDEESGIYSGKYSIIIPAANTNGSSDGKVTITDLVLLANYIANMDEEGHSTVVLGPKT